MVDGFVDGPVNEYLALNGSVTIRSVDDGAVAGTFTADFGPDRALEGTFDAAVCAE